MIELVFERVVLNLRNGSVEDRGRQLLARAKLHTANKCPDRPNCWVVVRHGHPLLNPVDQNQLHDPWATALLLKFLADFKREKPAE